MGRRLELQTLLETLMESDLTNPSNVYFQPKQSIKLTYPCIIYERDQARNHFADNFPYSHTKRWQITVIDKDPDSDIPDRVSAMPMSTFQRSFASDNLYHDIYSLYF